jgi:hypothetical protein
MARGRISRREAKVVAQDVVRRYQALGPADIEERFPKAVEVGIESWFEDAVDPHSGKEYSVGISISRPGPSEQWSVIAMVSAPWTDAAAEANGGVRRMIALGHWVIPVIKSGLIGRGSGVQG